MRKQRIKRPELDPWPQAQSTIRTGAHMPISEDPQTTPTQISKICAAMDKQGATQEFEQKQHLLKENDKLYTLPNLPPPGMRWQQPKKTRLRRKLLRP